jgi:hypothetical protein
MATLATGLPTRLMSANRIAFGTTSGAMIIGASVGGPLVIVGIGAAVTVVRPLPATEPPMMIALGKKAEIRLALPFERLWLVGFIISCIM